MSDQYTVEEFINALEPIKHDREENTMLVSVPLDLWDAYMGNEVIEPTQEKTYRVWVNVYHYFTVEAESEEEALEEAQGVMWDDHITDCQIDIEEVKHDDMQ